VEKKKHNADFLLCDQREMELKAIQHSLRKDRFARISLGLIKGESFQIPFFFSSLSKLNLLHLGNKCKAGREACVIRQSSHPQQKNLVSRREFFKLSKYEVIWRTE